MEFYAAERKKELTPFATAWMKLESMKEFLKTKSRKRLLKAILNCDSNAEARSTYHTGISNSEIIAGKWMDGGKAICATTDSG